MSLMKKNKKHKLKHLRWKNFHMNGFEMTTFLKGSGCLSRTVWIHALWDSAETKAWIELHLVPKCNTWHAFCCASCFISIASYWGISPSALNVTTSSTVEWGHVMRLINKSKLQEIGFVYFISWVFDIVSRAADVMLHTDTLNKQFFSFDLVHFSVQNRNSQN